MPVRRGEAQRGETVRLRMDFVLAGELFDPVEVRQVQILDSALTVLATIPAASIAREDTGQYYVDWSVPEAEPLEIHYDRWYATATAGATEKQFTRSFYVHSVTAGPTAYVSTAEAAAALPEGTLLSDSEIYELMLDCQAVIESVCGQSFLPVTESRVFNGQGRNTLNVKYPVQSVTQILVRGDYLNPECTMDLTDLRISPSRTMLGMGNVQPGGRSATEVGRLEPGCGVFPRGFANVQVTGAWGAYQSPPREIRMALLGLLRHAAACDDPHGVAAEAYETESVAGDRTWTLRKVWANVAVDGTTGFREIDSILARFMAPPVVMGVI